MSYRLKLQKPLGPGTWGAPALVSYRLKLHKPLGPELLQKDPVALGGDTHLRVQAGYWPSERITLALKSRGREYSKQRTSTLPAPAATAAERAGKEV